MPNWKKVLVSGSAAEVRHLTASGNIQANDGTIQANEFKVGSVFSVDISSLEHLNGAIFGNNAATDSHTITGRTKLVGNITASGNISASGETHVFGGDVGIGTQSPGEQLEVYANGEAVAIKIHEDAGTHQAKLHLRRGGSDWEIINDNHLSIEGEGNERLRIDTAGDVGINVTNPTEKLHVGGNVRTNTTQGYYGSFIQAISSAGMKIGNDDYSGFAFFKDDGNMGVGTSVPTKTLQVEGEISASGTGSFGHGVFNLPSAVSNQKILEVQKAGTNVFYVDEDGDGVFSGVVEFKNFIYGATGNTFVGGREDLVLGMNWNDDTDGTSIKFTKNELNNDPSNTLMVISSSGQVGIGLTEPTEKLEVAGKAIIRKSGTATAHGDTDLLVTDATAASSTAAIQILGGATGHSNLQFSDTAAYSQGGILYSHGTDTMTIKAGASTAVTITGSNQSVGIGTDEPQSLLHIHTGDGGTYSPNSNHDDLTIEGSGNIGLQLFSPNNSYQYIAFGDPDSVNAGYIRYHHGDNKMVFRTSGGDRVNIDSSGNVGIGTDSPDSKLHVVGDISASVSVVASSASFGSGDRGSDTSPIIFGDDIRIQDNVELRFGTGPSSGATTDFKILHDGTDNHITATIGAINIEGNGGAVNISQMGNGQGINLIPNHNPSNASIGSSGTVLISGSAQSLNGIRLDVRGDISSSATVIADEFKLSNGAFSVDSSGDITTANDLTAGNSAANDTHELTGKTRFDGHVTSSAGSNISASATSTITAGVGAFIELHGVGTETSLEVDGPITGSAFQGTKHILKAASFYINDDPMIQNSLYFGGNLGHQNSNWNDPQAVGGAISSTNSFTIAEDDMNWGYILPFDISGVEVQCSLRPAGGGTVTGDDFSLAIYTADRSNDSNTVITLTKVAHQSDTFNNANYATNDLTYTGNLDKGSMIFVGVGSETSGTPAKNARGLMNITIVAR